MKKLSSWLAGYAHILAAVLIIIQPIMDVISFWLSEFGISNAITLVLRMGVLAVAVLCGFILSDKKYVYLITATVMAAVYLGHIIACVQVGYVNPMADLANFIRVAQMPLLAISLITLFRKNEKTYSYVQVSASIVLLIMFAVQILSTVTGTDPHTYADGAGVLGWFYNTNSQSSNLSVLAPILTLWLLNWKKRNPVLICLSIIASCVSMYLFSTRLAYLGLMAFAVGMGVMTIVLRRSLWRYGVVFLACGILFAALMPISPMMKHLNQSTASQAERQEWLDAEIADKREDVENLISRLPGDEETTELDSETEDSFETEDSMGDNEEDPDDPDKDGLTEDEKKRLIEELTPIYEKYAGDFVEIFGAEKTMEMYEYTLDINAFSSTRAKKLMFAEMLMVNSPESAKWFGVEISRFTVGENIYDVENDFHGVYFLYGRVGFAVYMAFLLYFVVIIIKALLTNFKKYFTLDAAAYGIAFIMAMAHAYNTAGILRRPNASVYLSVILAVIYYLIYIRNYDKGEDKPVEKKN